MVGIGDGDADLDFEPLFVRDLPERLDLGTLTGAHFSLEELEEGEEEEDIKNIESGIKTLN